MLLEGSGRGVFTVRGFQPCCPIGWDFCHLPLFAQQPARKSFEVHVGDLWGSTCVPTSHVSPSFGFAFKPPHLEMAQELVGSSLDL